MAKAGRARFASEDLEAGTADEVQRAFEGYHAWFGRFTVSADEATVVHRSTLDGNDLVLASPPLPYGGGLVAFATHWRRVS